MSIERKHYKDYSPEEQRGICFDFQQKHYREQAIENLGLAFEMINPPVEKTEKGYGVWEVHKKRFEIALYGAHTLIPNIDSPAEATPYSSSEGMISDKQSDIHGEHPLDFHGLNYAGGKESKQEESQDELSDGAWFQLISEIEEGNTTLAELKSKYRIYKKD